MDYRNSTSITDNELWEWKEDDYFLQKDPHLEAPYSFREGDQDGHLSYMFHETTPVKACGDLAYDISKSGNVSNTRKNTNKEAKEYKGYFSQIKRRRMLQFNNNESTDSLFCSENTQYAFQGSKEKEVLMEDVAPENIEWQSGFFDVGGRSAPGNDGFDQPSDEWLNNCFNDGAMQLSSDDMNFSGFSGFSDDQIDISELCNTPYEMESDAVPVCPTPSPKIVYRGRKSYIRPPTNLASSVAYPFTLIKPCGVQGDVTLKDINQRILSPAPSMSKQDKDDDTPLVSYPTSAFSGKPVVIKTKIRTEGGKGSITIMRTKG